MTEPRAADPSENLRRRFVEVARRAEIVALVNAASSEGELGLRFAEELCEVFDAELAFVAEDGGSTGPPRSIAAVGIEPAQTVEILKNHQQSGARRTRAEIFRGEDLFGIGARVALLAPFTTDDGRHALIGVARLYDDAMDEGDRSLVEAVTLAVGHALERIWANEARDRGATRQRALVRAAKSISRSLEISNVLQMLAEEVQQALGCDCCAAMLGNENDGYVALGVAGIPDFLGFRHPPGQGLGARAIREGRVLVTHRYAEDVLAPPETSMWDEVRTCISAPLRWDDEFRAFISAGFHTQRPIAASDVELMDGFAELGGLACANAQRHARVRAAARVDGLTGCLNRDALEQRVGTAVNEAASAGRPLSLALLDLDKFKSINDLYGHQAGDAVLRSVGSALRGSLRGGDAVGRYGGDEFALVLPNSPERQVHPVVERVRAAIAKLEVPGDGLTACVGVAELEAGEMPSDLVRRADDALRAAKQAQGDDAVRRASRTSREPAGPPSERPSAWRRHMWRAVAGDIGLGIARNSQIASLTDGCSYCASELHSVLELTRCSVLRLTEDHCLETVASVGSPEDPDPDPDRERDAAVDGALREQRAMVGDRPASRRARELEAGHAAAKAAQVAVPLIVDEHTWGVLHCIGHEDQLDEVDAELASTVAEHLAASIRAAELDRRLSESMMGTAEALAAALEAKDSYTADHARSIAALVVETGRELHLSESELTTLRYAGIFHDVGKIAVPDAVINKPGPLDDKEWEIMRRHPAAGAEILAHVSHMDGVRSIVGAAHEHWDGAGYPEGLAGEEIPLGARIVLAADAFHAMTSERPYREARSQVEAITELRGCSGTQFDPAVVEALISVLERRDGAAGG